MPKKDYSAKDLEGIEIAHREDRIREGQTVVLTLKDQGVLDDGEDVLENANLIDDERVERNNLNKKLGVNTYNPYDDAEVDEFGIVHKKNVLSKYDEEISGAKKDSFKIGVNKEERRQKELEAIRSKLQKQKESLILSLPEVARDYMTIDEMASFKKPKKKIRKIRKREILKAEDLVPIGEEPAAGSDVDHGYRRRRERPTDDDDILGPDTDLSNIKVEDDLPEQRYREKLNKSKKVVRPEESIKQVASQIAAIKEEPEEQITSGVNFSSSMVLNATAEFCRTLGTISAYTLKEERLEKKPKEEDEVEIDDGT